MRKSFGSNFCNNCRRGFLSANVCGLEAVPLGGGEGAAWTGGYLPIHLDGCLRRPPPRERTASERNPVAHGSLQPLGREVSAFYGLTNSLRWRISDLR